MRSERVRGGVTPLLGHGHGLHVVTAEVGLQVQDGQLGVRLLQAQKLAKGGISLDRLLLHQVVATGIGHHCLGHSRTAHLRCLGQSQERAQLLRNLHRRGEDARLLGCTLYSLGLATTTAVGLLHYTGSLLLQRLQAHKSRLESGLQSR